MSRMDKESGPINPSDLERDQSSQLLDALSKSGALSDAELKILKKHPEILNQTIQHLKKTCVEKGSNEPLVTLESIAPLTLYLKARGLIEKDGSLNDENLETELHVEPKSVFHLKYGNRKTSLYKAYVLAGLGKPWPEDFDRIVEDPAFEVLIMSDDECNKYLLKLKPRIEMVRDKEAGLAADYSDAIHNIEDDVKREGWTKNTKRRLFEFSKKHGISRGADYIF